ncbi:helix-turn-helix domain-containing protein [Paenibacillus sp. YN15]|uniref:helix-turn-helix domain-containing protein n=1 Tax=Paenibacillus sp. YN15 TaxID=1742774 RepID=UPI0011BFE209|nr:helix-turn-helix domain-containing protein [Paenibacillus sp. YN15]
MLSKRPWFKRLLMSYLPVFLAIAAVLSILFVFAAVGVGKKEALRANRIFASQVQQSIDYSLRVVDQMILGELWMNTLWSDFFEPKPQTNRYLAEYELSSKLIGLTDNSPLIDSIYLVRFADQKVMTNSSMLSLESFPDRSFLQEAQSRTEEMRFWTSPRTAAGVGKEERSIFSLLLRYPLLDGEQGMVVVNIQTAAIAELLNSFSDSGLSFIRLYDDNGALVYGTDMQQGGAGYEKQPPTKNANVLTRIKSDYTGWEVQSGLKDGSYAGGYTIPPRVWLALAVLTVLLGIGFIIYITMRNYKPIGKIMESIETYASVEPPKLRNGGGGDEFAFIAKALDDLIRQTGEDVIYRRKLLFQELFEGSRAISPEQWREQLKGLGMEEPVDRLQTGIVDIDRYEDFCRSYNHRDQGLLRFALGNVVSELAEQQGLRIWAEWLTSQRMGLLILHQSGGQAPESEGRLQLVTGSAVEWVRQNLRLTITIALGVAVEKAAEVGLSYESAAEAMKYKSVLGNSRVIAQLDLPVQSPGDVFSQLQPIRAMATAFRLGEEKWRELLAQVMDALKKGRFSRDDIVNLMGYMLYQLNLELAGLPEESRRPWEEQAAPGLERVMGGMDTLEELSCQILPILEEQDALIRQIREKRAAHSIVWEARRFIEENYANPDMSLTYVGEHFHITSNYLSRLFKEETGENFVDYLARIRIQQAMRLLKETELTVQEVAVRAGYTHYVSFNRVFKRIAGVTPGDYRK